MLVDASRSCLLFIDLQTKLAPAVDQVDACVSHCRVLLAAARRLEIPILATEHCANRVGPTVPMLKQQLAPSEIIEKRHFNGMAEPSIKAAMAALDRKQVVVAGMEAHVCVLQTVLGLKTNGFEPLVVADAVASRRSSSRDLAICRMRDHGVDIVSTEMVLFEWLEVADNEAFKDLLPMIKTGSVD